MILNVKINGMPCELEINEKDLIVLTAPKDFTLQEAADYMGRSRQTILNWKVPKNGIGRYALETLNALKRESGKS